MPVQSRLERVRITRILFEARYDEGLRYLDHCGATLVQIRHHNPHWILSGADPQRTGMSNNKLDLTLTFNYESLVISTSKEHSATGIDKLMQDFGQEAEAVYRIVVETMRVPNTTRVGVRCFFVAPADTLEDAFRFVCKVPGSPLVDHLCKKTKFDLQNIGMNLTLEDPESGVRCRVTTSVVAVIPPEGPPLTGLATDSAAASSGGVQVDVDTFSRPEKGHLSDANMFIQSSYLKSRGLVMDSLDWMAQNQR